MNKFRLNILKIRTRLNKPLSPKRGTLGYWKTPKQDQLNSRVTVTFTEGQPSTTMPEEIYPDVIELANLHLNNSDPNGSLIE